MIQSSFDEIRTIDRDVFDCKYCAIVVGWKSAASAVGFSWATAREALGCRPVRGLGVRG